MKKLLALAFCLAALSGCHVNSTCHWDSNGDYYCSDDYHYYHTTPVVYTSYNNGGGSNNIIIVEEHTNYCSWEDPYYYDPEWCIAEEDYVCCMWMNIGAEETYCWDDWCGWELVDVYTYY